MVIWSNYFIGFGHLWWGECGGVEQFLLFQAGCRERGMVAT